jgi:hypothetical protein
VSLSWIHTYVHALLRKQTLATTVWRRVMCIAMANRAMVHLRQGVRHCAESCMTLVWKWTWVMNYSLRAQDSVFYYLCLLPKWGTVSLQVSINHGANYGGKKITNHCLATWGECIETHQDDLISLLLFFENKGIRLKTGHINSRSSGDYMIGRLLQQK